MKSNVLITAAHCTEYLSNTRIAGINEETEDEVFVLGWDETLDPDEDPSNGVSGGYFLVGKSSRIFRPAAINSRSIDTVNTSDLAVIYFDEDVAPATTPIASSAPGRHNGSDYWLWR